MHLRILSANYALRYHFNSELYRINKLIKIRMVCVYLSI